MRLSGCRGRLAGSRCPRLHSCWPCCRSLRSGRVEEGIVPTPEARHPMVDSFTPQYYYDGFSVAYRPTPQGLAPDDPGLTAQARTLDASSRRRAAGKPRLMK